MSFRTPFLAVLVLIAVTPASASADVAMTRPPLAVKLTACETGAQLLQRAAVFTASMPRRKSATFMAMRFRLQMRAPGQDSFTVVKAPGLSTWKRSDPDVLGLTFEKRIEALAAPAAYRVVVDFRWYGARGGVLDKAKRTSKVCRQPVPADGAR